jgi:hypothetical protein
LATEVSKIMAVERYEGEVPSAYCAARLATEVSKTMSVERYEQEVPSVLRPAGRAHWGGKPPRAYWDVPGVQRPAGHDEWRRLRLLRHPAPWTRITTPLRPMQGDDLHDVLGGGWSD